MQDELKLDPEKRVIEYDEDLPGYYNDFVLMCRGGQFYCLYCDKHFMNKEILDEHLTTKLHRKKLVEWWNGVIGSVKRANEEQYTQKEAEAAAGKTPEVYEPIRRDENGIPQ